MIYTQEGISVDSTFLKGDIADIPIEIVWRMVYYAKEQQHARLLVPIFKAFQKCRINGKNAGGFNWDQTPEGLEFWRVVLEKKNFSLYFDKYPTCKGSYTSESVDNFAFDVNRQMSSSLKNLILLRSRTRSWPCMQAHSISSLFTWSCTPEGHQFWHDVSTRKIVTLNKSENNNENKLQDKGSSVSRGAEIQGHLIYGKEGIASVTSRPLDYRGITGK